VHHTPLAAEAFCLSTRNGSDATAPPPPTSEEGMTAREPQFKAGRPRAAVRIGRAPGLWRAALATHQGGNANRKGRLEQPNGFRKAGPSLDIVDAAFPRAFAPAIGGHWFVGLRPAAFIASDFHGQLPARSLGLSDNV